MYRFSWEWDGLGVVIREDGESCYVQGEEGQKLYDELDNANASQQQELCRLYSVIIS